MYKRQNVNYTPQEVPDGGLAAISLSDLNESVPAVDMLLDEVYHAVIDLSLIHISFVLSLDFGIANSSAEPTAAAPYSLRGRKDASSKWKTHKPLSVSMHARPQSSTVLNMPRASSSPAGERAITCFPIQLR